MEHHYYTGDTLTPSADTRESSGDMVVSFRVEKAKFLDSMQSYNYEAAAHLLRLCPEVVHGRDPAGRTALFYLYLLRLCPEVDHGRDPAGRTALFYLSLQRKICCPLSLLRDMLAAGIKVDVIDGAGRTAIRYLLWMAHYHLVEHIAVLFLFGGRLYRGDYNKLSQNMAHMLEQQHAETWNVILATKLKDCQRMQQVLQALDSCSEEEKQTLRDAFLRNASPGGDGVLHGVDFSFLWGGAEDRSLKQYLHNAEWAAATQRFEMARDLLHRPPEWRRWLKEIKELIPGESATKGIKLTSSIQAYDAVDTPYRALPMAEGCENCATPSHLLSQLMQVGEYRELEREVKRYPDYLYSSHLFTDKTPLLSLLISARGSVCPLSTLRFLIQSGADVCATLPNGDSLLCDVLNHPKLHKLQEHILVLLLFGARVSEEERSAIEIRAHAHKGFSVEGAVLRHLNNVFMQWPDTDVNSPLPPQQLRLQEAFLLWQKTDGWVLGDFLLHGVNFRALCIQSQLNKDGSSDKKDSSSDEEDDNQEHTIAQEIEELKSFAWHRYEKEHPPFRSLPAPPRHDDPLGQIYSNFKKLIKRGKWEQAGACLRTSEDCLPGPIHKESILFYLVRGEQVCPLWLLCDILQRGVDTRAVNCMSNTLLGDLFLDNRLHRAYSLILVLLLFGLPVREKDYDRVQMLTRLCKNMGGTGHGRAWDRRIPNTLLLDTFQKLETALQDWPKVAVSESALQESTFEGRLSVQVPLDERAQELRQLLLQTRSTGCAPPATTSLLLHGVDYCCVFDTLVTELEHQSPPVTEDTSPARCTRSHEVVVRGPVFLDVD